MHKCRKHNNITYDCGEEQHWWTVAQQNSVSRFEWIDLAITSMLANQPVASESERARDQCIMAGTRVRVKFSLGVMVSGLITVMVDVRVMVKVSDLLGSDYGQIKLKQK